MAASRSQHRTNSMSTPLRWVNTQWGWYILVACQPLYALSPVVGVAVTVAAVIILLIRTARCGVTLTAGSLVIREMLRTRIIIYSDISAVEEVPYKALYTWGAMSNGHMLQVVHADGTRYRLRGTAGGEDLLPVSRTKRRAEFKSELEARVQAASNSN